MWRYLQDRIGGNQLRICDCRLQIWDAEAAGRQRTEDGGNQVIRGTGNIEPATQAAGKVQPYGVLSAVDFRR
jgi:hypothetical protein